MCTFWTFCHIEVLNQRKIFLFIMKTIFLRCLVLQNVTPKGHGISCLSAVVFYIQTCIYLARTWASLTNHLQRQIACSKWRKTKVSRALRCLMVILCVMYISITLKRYALSAHTLYLCFMINIMH